MIEPKPTSFRPKWPVKLSPAEESIAESGLASGATPVQSPEINTRIIPSSGRIEIRLASLSDIASQMQHLADYAGYDVVHGPNPNFSNLRSLGSEISSLTKLTVHPFAEGSFVIPTSLDSGPISVALATGNRTFESNEVVRRFDQILIKLAASDKPTDISTGALQSIELMGRVMRRENAEIEFSTVDSKAIYSSKHRVDLGFVRHVSDIIRSRRESLEIQQVIEGRITALDLTKSTFFLTPSDSRRRIRGSFSNMFTPTMEVSLNRLVRLEGNFVESPTGVRTLQVIGVELVDTE